MNAQEARELSTQNNKVMDKIRDAISKAANRGETGAMVWTGLSNKSKDAEKFNEIKTALTSEGYDIEGHYSDGGEDYKITIKW